MVIRLIMGLLLVVAMIHLLPFSGFFGADRIAALYGIDLADRNLEILMRHRSALFGILGLFFVYATFRPAVQPIAFAVAFASIASFFFIAFSVGGFNDAIKRVVVADVVAAISLLAAIALYYINSKRQ